MKTPTPEYEIKYLIAEENNKTFGDLSAGDIDRVLTYFQNNRPDAFRDSIQSAHFGHTFLKHLTDMDHHDAIRQTLVDLTCINEMFDDIARKIALEPEE